MDIYSIGDGAFLEQVITAVTLVSGAGEFASMAKIGILFGFIMVLFQAIVSGGRNINIAQIGVAGLLYALMFGSTQTVTVTDAYTQEVRVIDNVPTGVAATGSFLSSIGYNLTELFETSFSTPTMTKQGYGFSLDVLKRVRMNSLTESMLGVANAAREGADFYESWSEYIKTCTIIGIELGHVSKDNLFRSPDFMSALEYDDPDFGTRIKTGPTPQDLRCPPAFAILETFTLNEFLPSFKENVLPGVLGLQQPAGAAEVEATINDALNGLGVGPAPRSRFTSLNSQPITADDFIISSVLVPIYYYGVRKRYIQDAKFTYADQIDDSVRARNSQWMANQSLFDRYLRPMLTFVEGFMFAVTPILALLIPVGAAGIGMAGRFLLVGAWIQLWMPALAIVNLFIHNVVAGKMSALADAGTPLTSLAGLHQGDDIIQTWLGTGGLMASAVPVLTLMIVYGGAISANFFATRLQGEDVVMERQAAGATFNPYPQLHVDPPRTRDQTAGADLQSGAAGRLPTYNWNESLGKTTASALQAHETATDQFENRFQQSVGNTLSTQSSATTGMGVSQRITEEGGRAETVMDQELGDISRQLANNTGLSEQEAKNVTYGAALNGIFGTKLSLGGSETKTLSAEQLERVSGQVGTRIAEGTEARSSIVDATAFDVHNATSDAYISATNLGKDEALSQSAQDVVSTGQSYNEAVQAGSSLSADRHVNAKDMIPAIARSDQAQKELSEMIMQNGLGGEVGVYQGMMGARNEESFGEPELERLYAMTEVATSHLGDGDARSERIAAGLADVFSSAEGFNFRPGDAGANRYLADEGPAFGETQPLVERGLGGEPAGVEEFNRGRETIENQVDAGMANAPALEGTPKERLEEAREKMLIEENARRLALQEQRSQALEGTTPILDAPAKALEAIKADPENPRLKDSP